MTAVAQMLRLPGESQLSRLLNQAPIGLALCQSSGNITSANTKFQDLLGLPSSPVQHALSELIQDDNESRRLIGEVFCGTRTSFQIECPAMESDGKPLRWTMWPIQGADHQADCAVVMVEDLSEIAEARGRLQQTERLETIGRLAGGVAHDFNNLLTGILLYCDLLMSVVGPADRVRKYAEEIRSAGLQASGLVRQLLSVVRTNNSLPRPVSLNEVAEGMRNLLVRLIGETIELKLQLDPALGLVKIDPVQVQQILLNLVLNARDALPDGGEISVRTSNCNMHVLQGDVGSTSANTSLPCALFSVEDNGMGMDESVRAHLFEPFFTTKIGKGTGIGLATVHDIVRSNGGLIHVQSEVHHGTRISVFLPILPETVADSLQDTDSNSRSNGENSLIPIRGN